jgi:hypothetical protein
MGDERIVLFTAIFQAGFSTGHTPFPIKLSARANPGKFLGHLTGTPDRHTAQSLSQSCDPEIP